MEQRKVDSYADFRNGDFWDLWVLGHIAHTQDEFELVKREKMRLAPIERDSLKYQNGHSRFRDSRMKCIDNP
jgi:hypothetical protein